MLKALFFAMDETLCETQKANDNAEAELAAEVRSRYGADIDVGTWARDYVKGIHRQWSL